MFLNMILYSIHNTITKDSMATLKLYIYFKTLNDIIKCNLLYMVYKWMVINS